MKKIAFVLAAFVPTVVAAQSTAASAATTTQAAARADVPASFSAESQAKISATYERARQKRLPDQPIRDRVAEGQAKGASEGQLVIAAQRAEARLEAAQSAMIRAGRQPNDAELIRAEAALARGATEAQIEAAAKSVQPDQQLTVQLDAIAAGSSTGANVAAGATVSTPKVGASAGVTGAAMAATGVATTAAGSATAGVGAVIKKPPTI